MIGQNDINFEELISKKLLFLQQMGYSKPVFSYKEFKSPSTGSVYPDLEIHLEKEKLRSIKIAIILPILSIYISITSSENYFDFNSYLKLIKDNSGDDLYKDFFPNRDDINSQKMYCLSYLDLFSKYAQTKLKLVLEGKEWIDVPYHWGPYK